MKYKWKQALIVLLLTVSMMLSMPAVGVMAADGDDPAGGSGDPATEENWLEKKSTLTILPSGNSIFKTDLLANGNIVYDIYRVAGAAPVSSVMTYMFTQLDSSPFDLAELGLNITSYEGLHGLDVDTWRSYADIVGRFVLEKVLTDDTSDDIAPTLTLAPDASAELDSGLYLIIAHSSNLEGKNYVKLDGSTILGSIVNTSEYDYTFGPELIALPSPLETIPNTDPNADPPSGGTGGSGGAGGFDPTNPFTTASGLGEWSYNVTATLKPVREVCYGDLLISKTLAKYNTTDETLDDVNGYETDPVSFVFHLEWYKENDDGSVLEGDDYLMYTFTATGEKHTFYEGRFPVGTHIRVTEVYPGSGYKLTSDKVVGSLDGDFVIVPRVEYKDQDNDGTIDEVENDPLTASFTNEIDNEQVKGYGILNQYSITNNNNYISWTGVNTGDSADSDAAGNG